MRSKEVAEEPPVAVLSPIVGALLALELTETAVRALAIYAPPRLRWDAIAYPFLPLAVAMLLPGALAAKAGRAGTLMLACGLGLDAVLMLRFRGLWTWTGTLDYYWTSPHPWMIALVSGATLGFIFGKPLRSRKPLSSTGLTVLMMSAFGIALVNWILAHTWAKQIDSYFPPTRLFATGGIVLALGVLWYARVLEPETASA